MKLIGKETWGLAKRALARLIAHQRRMGKKKWFDGIDIRRLSGEEWLRLLSGETNMAAFVGWCAQCRTGKCREKICHHCGAKLLLFDEEFWCQIGRKIQRALRRDSTLLSQVKCERESLYSTPNKPTFPSPLDWLSTAWEHTPRPPHHPFDPKVHYLVANWVESLRRAGLSKEEISEVLSTDDFPDGQFERKGKGYANIPGEELRKVGAEFRRAVGYIPGSVLDCSEMSRTIRWVNRQRTVPMARLKGERVRKRNFAEN